MTLNQTPPNELRIFIRQPRINQNGSQMFMVLDPLLEAAIASRWQDIVSQYPGLIASDDGVGILVRDLFEQLQANLMNRKIEIDRLTYVLLRANLSEEALSEYWKVFLYRSNSNDEYIEKYWLSFLFSIALEVTSRVSRTTGLRFSDVRCACIGSIGNLYRFYRTYNNTDPDRQLLSNLKAYASRKIRQSSYAHLQLQFDDDTIGRGNLGLITRYKSKIEEALRWVNVDSSTNQILDEDTIQRNVALCKTTIEYLRHINRTRTRRLQINELNSSHFDLIGQLYCRNTSRTKYLQEINQGRNKQERLTINNLSQKDLDCIALLCGKLNDELPSSIHTVLDTTGGFIRQFVRKFQPVPIEGSFGTDVDEPDLIDRIESNESPPGTILENLELQEIIRSEISDYYHQLVSIDKKILYLKDSFNLGQDCIKYIVVIDQPAIDQPAVSKKIAKTNIKIRDFVIEKMSSSKYKYDQKSILAMIVETFESNFELETISTVERPYYQRLRPSIEAYEEYFEYLIQARRHYPGLAGTLKEIKQQHGYAQQFDYLANLPLEQYPKLKPELNMPSFLTLIERIQNILEEKVQNSSDELWN
jgi:hypothetical protein